MEPEGRKEKEYEKREKENGIKSKTNRERKNEVTKIGRDIKRRNKGREKKKIETGE